MLENKKFRYCRYCNKFDSCDLEKKCHGRRFESRYGMHFNGAFIPSYMEDTVTKFIEKYDGSVRAISDMDSNTIGIKLIAGCYEGNKPWDSLTALDVWIGDVGNVTAKYADIFLKDCITGAKFPHVIRCARDSGRIYIIKGE